jgi:transposase
MPKRYPPEFKRDVVHIARTSGLTHAQIAEDFGISEHSMQRWLKQANIDDGIVEGTTTSEQDELAALNAATGFSSKRWRFFVGQPRNFAKDAAPK